MDIRRPALQVVEHMHLLAPLHDAATLARSLTVVDVRGGRIGWISSQGSADAIEVPRSALAGILNSAAQVHADFRYNDSVLSLHNNVHGVDVMHNAPGRAVAIHPAAGREMVAFIFRPPARPNIHEQDMGKAKQLVIDVYGGMKWRVPELLEQVRDSEDLYFDYVSRIRLDSWTRGRVALVGDAASCVSLLGEGSSMAIAGAATLAHELGAQAGASATALYRYEQTHTGDA